MAKYKLVSKKGLTKFVRRLGRGESVNEREIAIFEKNFILGFFTPKLEGKNKMSYSAPEGLSLAAYIKQDMTAYRFYSILAQTVEIAKQVNQHGFYMSNLMLDLQLVYVKETTGQLFFLYEPIVSRDNASNLFGFLEQVVARIEKEHKDKAEITAPFKALLQSNDIYRLEDIEKFVETNYPQIYQAVHKSSGKTGMSGFMASNRLSYNQHYQEDKSQKDLSQKANYEDGELETTLLQEEETTILMEEEGTVLLNQRKTLTLERLSTGEIVYVDKPEFRIGKDASLDYAISDNKAISRNHASIFEEFDGYYLMDLNSTNHSYINGQLLEAGKKTEINDGDIIKLANEEFNVCVK